MIPRMCWRCLKEYVSRVIYQVILIGAASELKVTVCQECYLAINDFMEQFRIPSVQVERT